VAQCKICSNEKARDINRLFLTHGQIGMVSRQFGLNRGTVSNHLRKHLPWRSRRRPKPVSTAELLEELQYELARLAVLAECGEKIGAAVAALREKRAVYELQMRAAGVLSSTHRKLLPAQPMEGNYEVVFEGGRPRTVKKDSVPS
jgi:transposase-like protein